jgi:hypothetical protein
MFHHKELLAIAITSFVLGIQEKKQEGKRTQKWES